MQLALNDPFLRLLSSSIYFVPNFLPPQVHMAAPHNIKKGNMPSLTIWYDQERNTYFQHETFSKFMWSNFTKPGESSSRIHKETHEPMHGTFTLDRNLALFEKDVLPYCGYVIQPTENTYDQYGQYLEDTYREIMNYFRTYNEDDEGNIFIWENELLDLVEKHPNKHDKWGDFFLSDEDNLKIVYIEKPIEQLLRPMISNDFFQDFEKIRAGEKPSYISESDITINF